MLKTNRLKINIKTLSSSATNLRTAVKVAAEEVRMHKNGQLKLKTAQDLLTEL